MRLFVFQPGWTRKVAETAHLGKLFHYQILTLNVSDDRALALLQLRLRLSRGE